MKFLPRKLVIVKGISLTHFLRAVSSWFNSRHLLLIHNIFNRNFSAILGNTFKYRYAALSGKQGSMITDIS